jgi:hypothetical protein
MLMSRQWPLVALALLTCFSASACNNGGPPAAGVPGAPEGQGGPAAPVSPLKIPNVEQGGGLPLSEVEDSLLTGAPLPTDPPGTHYLGLIDQFGGTLCVTLKIKQEGSPEAQPCGFIRTDPPLGQTIQRRATLTIYVSPGPCTAGSSSP